MPEITFIGDAFKHSITDIGMYSDSTTMVKTDAFDRICEKADTVELKATTLASLMAGLSVVDAIRATASPTRIPKLVLPYIPGARQDRANPTGDVGFMLKTVSRLINAYEFESVLVADAHSPVAGQLIDNLIEYPLETIYSHLYKGYGGVIAPDKGAQERGEVAASVLGRPLVYGRKVRDVSTGRLSGFEVDVVPGTHYIVVDDICDGGGTFLGLGEKIREQGAYADLFVTHGIFSKGTTELKKIYKNIYTTNTRSVHERNDVITFDITTGMRNYR